MWVSTRDSIGKAHIIHTLAMPAMAGARSLFNKRLRAAGLTPAAISSPKG